MTKENYKAYFWANMYLSDKQAGIQSLHCLQEINNKWPTVPMFEGDGRERVRQWAFYDKTVIVCNGGTSGNLEGILKTLCIHNYPFAYFMEDGIGNPFAPEEFQKSLTCVGIIVPEKIWGARIERHGISRGWETEMTYTCPGLSEKEIELARLIQRSRLF